MTAPSAVVRYCGEDLPVPRDGPLVIGRDGPFDVDENPYLHRRFLSIELRGGMWWLGNVGTRLTATVADEPGTMQAWLAPGAALPLVFARTVVWFTAGPTTYEFEIDLEPAPFVQIPVEPDATGTSTIGRMSLTPDQKRLLVALCEPALRRGNHGTANVPSSAAAAQRLGWQLTRFNRKLDNVCQKVAAAGIRGVHGEPGRLATNRRARLVEYALAARIVSVADLDLLPTPENRTNS